MKLKQINISKPLTQSQINKIKELVPVIEEHNNGKFWIKKLNTHLESEAELRELRLKIMKIIKTESSEILMIYQDK